MLGYNEYGHSVCECGYTSCGGGRGCGHCSDCMGEHCECHIIDRYDDDVTEQDFPPGTKFVN